MSGIKLGGQWKTPSIVYTKVDDEWTIVAQTFAKIGGVWRTTTFGSPPDQPQVAYVTTGVFEITNYDPTLVYEATLVSGGGTATFNASNGRYTLSNANARFSVVARYVAGAPASDPAYIERKAYTYYTETFTTTCTDTRTVYYDCSYTVNEYYYCCGDPCVNNLCPPQDGWGCNNGTCCTSYCVRTRTVSQTCSRQETYTYSCTDTRQVRNPTPAGYTDSGVEWYRLD
jgi:hypothetical protein